MDTHQFFADRISFDLHNQRTYYLVARNVRVWWLDGHHHQFHEIS